MSSGLTSCDSIADAATSNNTTPDTCHPILVGGAPPPGGGGGGYVTNAGRTLLPVVAKN